MNSELTESIQGLELAEKERLLLDALVSGTPISIARSELSSNKSAMGDVFIKAWATKTVLEEFLRQHDRQDHPSVYVSFYDDRNSGNKHFPFDACFPYAGRPAVNEKTCTEISLADMALRMRLKLPPSVFQLRTTPFAFDHPNFNSWEVTYDASSSKADAEKKQAIYTLRVSEQGIEDELARLKGKYEGREVIVVNIAGSHVFKRFSFAQVQQITHELRQKFENAHIVVLADQETRIYDQPKNVTLPLIQRSNTSENRRDSTKV